MWSYADSLLVSATAREDLTIGEPPPCGRLSWAVHVSIHTGPDAARGHERADADETAHRTRLTSRHIGFFRRFRVHGLAASSQLSHKCPIESRRIPTAADDTLTILPAKFGIASAPTGQACAGVAEAPNGAQSAYVSKKFSGGLRPSRIPFCCKRSDRKRSCASERRQ